MSCFGWLSLQKNYEARIPLVNQLALFAILRQYTIALISAKHHGREQARQKKKKKKDSFKQMLRAFLKVFLAEFVIIFLLFRCFDFSHEYVGFISLIRIKPAPWP